MVTSEAAPFAKTGGLADVLGALPPALARLGEEVAVVMPRYGSVPLHGSMRISDPMRVSVGPNAFTVAIDQMEREGVRYLFVDCPPLYARAGIYSEDGVAYVDNHIRFALLNQAALEIGRSIFRQIGPDGLQFLVHAGDGNLKPLYFGFDLLGRNQIMLDVQRSGRNQVCTADCNAARNRDAV